jgi:GTPase SAR1 family protein
MSERPVPSWQSVTSLSDHGGQRKFRILVVGPTNIGKSTMINRFIGLEPFDEHGGPVDGAARTSHTGSGDGGCTAHCESYFFQYKGISFELVDSIGVGTTSDEVEERGGLIAEFEDMQSRGDRFDVILYCVNATQQAQGLAATVNQIIRFGFLDDEQKLWENVILVGMQAEPDTMRKSQRYKKFEQDVKAGFFKDAPSQTGKHAFTYLPGETAEKDPTVCADLFIGDLLEQIEATPSWKDFDALGTGTGCFEYKPPSDEQIEAMFIPLFKSTMSAEAMKPQLDVIKTSCKRMRDELAKVRKEYEEKMRQVNDFEAKEGHHEALKQATERAGQLYSGRKKPELVQMATDMGLKQCGGWGRSLIGCTAQPKKMDFVEHIVHALFPLANYLGHVRSKRAAEPEGSSPAKKKATPCSKRQRTGGV